MNKTYLTPLVCRQRIGVKWYVVERPIYVSKPPINIVQFGSLTNNHSHTSV